jgi:DNA polymerase II small subunit
MKERLFALLAERGTLPEPEAVRYILEHPDPLDWTEGVLSTVDEAPFILTIEDLRRWESIGSRAAAKAKRRPGPPSTSRAPKAAKAAGEAKDYDSQVTILRDITGNSACEGKIGDFVGYFRSRFQSLKAILGRHRGLARTMPLERGLRTTREFSSVVMVRTAKTTRKGHLILEVEDESESANVLVPPGTPHDPIVPDEVLGIIGSSGRDGLIIASRVIHPEVPPRNVFGGGKDPVSVAFVSDIHVGAKTFLDAEWHRFMGWLNDGDPWARSVKYLVISGDAVDGIGVYPRQDEELSIDDVHAQYESLGELLQGIPDWVETIILPGNHDAVRPAEPQPAFSQSIRKNLDSNITFVGNPALMDLHGVKVLAYHGKSMDDFVSTLPAMTYETPLLAMQQMLKKRHLAPTYGGRTPIAPEKEDLLVMDTVPDILVTGHVHHVGVDEYRGVRMVNASTWQSRTPYQKMRNYNPLPARVPIINLATGDWVIREF